MRRRVLVVEDDTIQADCIADVLTSKGFPSRSVLNAEAALSNLATEKYDFFIIDLYMPGMNGIELITRLREITKESTPIIMITAGTNGVLKEVIEKLNSLQPAVLLQKPFNFDLLFSTLLKLKDECYDNPKGQTVTKSVLSTIDGKSVTGSQG